MILADKINKETGRHLLINEGISNMHFEIDMDTYCPLGKNVMTKKVIVDIELGKYIPDLLDIENIRDELTNGCYINEDLLIEWKNRLKFIKAKNIKVKVCSNGHFPLYID